MKRISCIFLAAMLVVVFSAVLAGCVGQPVTPQTQVPTPTQTASVITASPISAQSEGANKYTVGAEIQKDANDSTFDKDHGWVIVKVNNDGTYAVAQIYNDIEARKWYKIYQDPIIVREFAAVERNYPILVGYIEWNTFPVKYYVKDDLRGGDGITKLTWTTPSPTSTPPTISPENMTRVHAEGFTSTSGINPSTRTVHTMNTVEMTNLGSVDAENVQVSMTWTYMGRSFGQQTLYFGTVKVGLPVKKEFVMEVQLTPSDWTQYTQNSNYENIRSQFGKITGNNVIDSSILPTPTIRPTAIPTPTPTLGNSTVPKYKAGDIIGNKEKSYYNDYPRDYNGKPVVLDDVAYMVIGLNLSASGNYYHLANQIFETRRTTPMFLSLDSPPVELEINVAEQKYPYLIDTYQI